ncbi:hypothetical protein [Methanobacterium aggregans]|uniref:hypothetical protein n=1 Tax=Methanobacterium aggregans TaxID=1615586 RepID=UPI001AE87F5B|nr:hypothetical protein [Methanobacterium aggregans]MBP2045374.1 putative FlaG/YvyC family protein [Methanobacterium aggregans]
MESKSKKIENSFWNIQNIIIISLSFIIPLSLIFVNLLGVYAGFSIGNSIALLTAGLAITGTLYSNYRNNIRNQDQLDAAEKRLDKQLKEQKKNLNQQLKSAERRLDKQLKVQKKNLNQQLDSAKENLREELIFDKKSNAVLGVETAFFEYNNLPDDRFKNKHLCKRLRVIRETPDEFYYLPKELKKAILDFYDYTRKNKYTSDCVPLHAGSRLPNDDEIEIYFKEIDDQLQKALKDLDETIYIRSY